MQHAFGELLSELRMRETLDSMLSLSQVQWEAPLMI
jgi:hypothetical protein